MIEKTRILLFAASWVALCLAACDEGDIVEATDDVPVSGKTAILTARISGAESWSSQYSLVLAAFAEGSDNAVSQKQITSSESSANSKLPDSSVLDGFPVETSLKLTSDDIATIELCVTNRLRQRIISFASVPVGSFTGDTIRLDAGNVDTDMFGAIQTQVFTPTCARCHGLGTTPAAQLTLVEGQSYEQLVGHPSSNPDRVTRVVPGDADASLLHKVLRGDADAGVHFDHNNMIKEPNTLTLIDNWIKSLQR